MILLPDAERQALFGLLDPENKAEVLEEADPDTAARLVRNTDPGALADLVEAMPADEAADLLQAMDAADAARVLPLMDPEATRDVREILRHPPRRSRRSGPLPDEPWHHTSTWSTAKSGSGASSICIG